MSNPVIRVENLSKKYIIGHQQQEKYTALRDVIANGTRSLGHKLTRRKQAEDPTREEFWALKDVSFEVNQGDRVGIIGRNGAGKSTLLKVLSRIVEPTQGSVRIRGRVSSLLEVGTGFHPELTGRENIFLNGAILGMSKVEIKRKFDEIVAFAEVEKFLDTPVKRYSSGMYVRLAFAVAAHLEPEILIVDEVLAVGDAQFQKKCLGKMEKVGKEGRTVIFVSHNMQAIQSLCEKAIYLKQGQLISLGKCQPVVAQYLTMTGNIDSEIAWKEESAPGNQDFKLTAVRVSSQDGNSGGVYSSKNSLLFEVEFVSSSVHPGLCIGFDLLTQDGFTVLRSYQTDLPPEQTLPVQVGKNRWCCNVPAGLLNAGIYHLAPRIGIHNQYWIVHLDPVVQFEVVLDHGISPFWNSLQGRRRPGAIAPILSWNTQLVATAQTNYDVEQV